ncbi:MAG TPA: hypothetical protein VMW17_03185 [Candidatus Binatia bacterium]|nr:hypothetical protein [Candidatus Binatia bacterium]
MNQRTCAYIAVACCAAARVASAQLNERALQPLGANAGELIGLSKPASKGLTDFLSAAFKDELTDTDRLNRIIGSYLERTSGLNFLGDINFRLKTFHEDGGPSNLGFSYAFSREVTNYTFGTTDPTTHRGLDLTFHANGNVAFDRSTNPEDFLDTKLNVSFFQSTGGASALDSAGVEKYNELSTAIVTKYHGATVEVINASKEMAELRALIQDHLRNQLAFDLAGEAGLESNQSFSDKQYVYGGRVGMVFKAWDDRSAWARWNVFDLPFATLRYLIGTDDHFSPSGKSYPAVLVGGALVDPDGEDPRTAVAGKSSYPRVRGEVSFRTRFIDLGKWEPVKALGQTYLTANERYYWEVGASQAVKNANLDNFGYFVATLDTTVGVFVSYSVGRLPFDAKDDQIYDVGFKFHF